MWFQVMSFPAIKPWLCWAVVLLTWCSAAPQAGDEEEYVFVKTDRWVTLIQGQTESIGKLDEAGNFIPDKAFFQRKRGQPGSSPGSTLLNGAAQKGIYEYRSGRLIPGEIDDDGNFIPIVGEKIIDFKDYRYHPKGPKIYNLPGKFVRKGEKEEKNKRARGGEPNPLTPSL